MSIFEVEPPRWLQDLTRPVEPGETGKIFGNLIGGIGAAVRRSKEKNDSGEQTNWLKELPAGIRDSEMDFADPMWRLKAQEAQLNIAGQKLQMDMRQQNLDLEKQHATWMNHDVQTFPQWMKNHPTPESRAGAQPPDLLTPQFQKTFQEVVKGDINHDAQRDFTRQIDELRKLDPVAAAKYAPLIGRPIPQKAVDQLGTDMAAAKTKAVLDVVPKPITVEIDGKKVNLIVNPKTGHFERMDKSSDALTKAESSLLMGEIKDLRKQLGETSKRTNPDKYGDILDKLTKAQRNLRKLYSPSSAAASASAPAATASAPVPEGAVSTREQFDALPSGAIYTGKDGKRYRKP